MPRSLIERRLRQVAGRLQELRRELEVSGEQLLHLADEAEDARLRALISETPTSDHECRNAERHADAMRQHRAVVSAEIARLEQQQDELLDRLQAER
jgi:DNA-binding transcriptional MerR regulator